MAGLFGGARRALSNFAQTDSRGRTFGDKLSILGATLRDVSNPDQDNLGRMVNRIDDNIAMRQHQQAMDRLRSEVSPLDGPNGSGTGRARTPQEIQAALLQGQLSGLNTGAISQQFQPRLFQTQKGIVSVSPEGKPEVIYSDPETPKASPGWNVQPDGSWTPVPGGPYDPAYIGRTTGVRRDAVVARPTPSRARPSSGASGATSARPSAPAAPSRRPWENYR